MSIYPEFQPTYLYIKQHSVTGLKYLGKTVKTNLDTYYGSGKYWKKHIKAHGKEHVKTIWAERFYTQESLIEAALKITRENNIVESPDWANLIEENGLDGTPVGVRFTEKHRKNMSIAATGKKMSDEARAKMRANNIGKKMSDEAIAKMRAYHTGKKRPPEVGEKVRAAKLGKPRPDVSARFALIRAGKTPKPEKVRKGKPRPDVAERNRERWAMFRLLRSQKALSESTAA